MIEPQVHYDVEGDILYISFRPWEHAMGINLTEHILLRLHPETREAIGLTLLDFSVLVQPTEVGPRSFPLIGLNDLPDTLRQTVITLLITPPVNRFVKVSLYTPSPKQRVPLLYVEYPALAIPV
jgi:uncharacterized protein YuzE